MSTDDDWLASSPWARLWPDDTQRLILSETDSTMAEAARRAPPERPIWIMAHRQTAARGRRGRAWSQEDGNFAATYLCRPDHRPAREAALTSFVAALSVVEALQSWLDSDDITLKWPNDVLVRGHKIAGILLESAGRGQGLDWLSVGIGVNLTTAPRSDTLEDGALGATCIADHGTWPRFEAADREPEVFLAHLAHGLESHLGIWDGTGFEAIRTLWLARAARLGQQVTARTSQTSTSGFFEDLDDDGCLVLRTESGLSRIAAADVYF